MSSEELTVQIQDRRGNGGIMGEGFPERLRQLRTRRHISQRTLSQLCGLGTNAIARYESGERVPTLPALEAIADYFGITMDDLARRAKGPGACDFGKRL